MAVTHGYPPGWSMGGEVATHRTVRAVPGSTVLTDCDEEYLIDGVRVLPLRGPSHEEVELAVRALDPTVLFAHSSMATAAIQAARSLKVPSILSVHAPQKFASDLRRAWSRATLRLYNTEAARQDWHDDRGMVLHPPVMPPSDEVLQWVQRGDALTLTSSLTNKGAGHVLTLAARWPHRRFIIVESPAHDTHGDPAFWEIAASLPNVEVWPRQHPDAMWRVWAETKVLLVPSRYETYGMSAVEAAWFGIPSVHVDTVHVREGIGTAARLMDWPGLRGLESGVREVEADYEEWSEKAEDMAVELHRRTQDELAAFAARVALL